MQKYKLKRFMQYTEEMEVEVESWDDAEALIGNAEAEFERNNDDTILDSSIEYLGESPELINRR